MRETNEEWKKRSSVYDDDKLSVLEAAQPKRNFYHIFSSEWHSNAMFNHADVVTLLLLLLLQLLLLLLLLLSQLRSFFFINSPSSRLFCRYILFLHRIFARYRIFSCKCFFFIQRLFIYLVWSASTLQTLQSGFQRLLLLFLSFYAAADKIIWLEYSNRCLEKMWTIYFLII